MLTSKANDSYLVVKKNPFPLDLDVLVRLYQVLIGADALSLYLLLYQESGAPKRHHSYLYQTLALIAPEFDQARYLLESCKLLRTLHDQKGNFVYELQPPLTADRLLKVSVFKELIKGRLGKEDYEKVKKIFKAVNVGGLDYQDVSATFQEIFVSSASVDPLEITSSEGASASLTLATLMTLCPTFKPQAFTQAIVTEIEEIIALYQMSISELKPFLYGAYDARKGKININKLVNALSNNFLAQMPDLEVTPVTAYSQYTPLQFLAFKYGKEHQPTAADQKLITNICRTIRLPHPLINVIIDFCLKNYDSTLTETLIGRIAGKLIRKRVATVEEALALLDPTYSQNVPEEQEVMDLADLIKEVQHGKD